MIGPRWFTRLAYRERWARLDGLMTAEVRAVNLTTTWQVHAETATGERLWYCNLLAALSEQVVHDAKDAWLALYDGRWSAAAEHALRMQRHAEELETAAREMVAAGYARELELAS